MSTLFRRMPPAALRREGGGALMVAVRLADLVSPLRNGRLPWRGLPVGAGHRGDGADPARVSRWCSARS